MAGQIIKRGDKRWLVRIFQGRDENGKRRYVNKTIRGTKKNAESYLTAKLRDKDLGINIEPAAESLNKYLDKWLDTAAKPGPGHSTTTQVCSSDTCAILWVLSGFQTFGQFTSNGYIGKCRMMVSRRA